MRTDRKRTALLIKGGEGRKGLYRALEENKGSRLSHQGKGGRGGDWGVLVRLVGKKKRKGVPFYRHFLPKEAKSLFSGPSMTQGKQAVEPLVGRKEEKRESWLCPCKGKKGSADSINFSQKKILRLLHLDERKGPATHCSGRSSIKGEEKQGLARRKKEGKEAPIYPSSQERGDLPGRQKSSVLAGERKTPTAFHYKEG